MTSKRKKFFFVFPMIFVFLRKFYFHVISVSAEIETTATPFHHQEDICKTRGFQRAISPQGVASFSPNGHAHSRLSPAWGRLGAGRTSRLLRTAKVVQKCCFHTAATAKSLLQASPFTTRSTVKQSFIKSQFKKE